jgi:hypothetical protein
MPEQYLISPQGETKHVFRAAMKRIIPNEILNRKDKIGFETPEKNWLVEIAPTIRKLIREDLQLPFLRQDKLLQEFETVIQGKKTIFMANLALDKFWALAFYKFSLIKNYPPNPQQHDALFDL